MLKVLTRSVVFRFPDDLYSIFNSVLNLTFIEKTLEFSHSLLIVKYNKAVVLYCTPETKLKTFSIELLNFFIKLEIKEVGSWPELHTNYPSKKSLEDRTPIKSSLRYVVLGVVLCAATDQ